MATKNETRWKRSFIRQFIFHSPIPGKLAMNFRSTSGVIRTLSLAVLAVIGVSLFADQAQAQSCRYNRGYGSFYSSPGFSIGFSTSNYNRYGSGFSIGYSTYRPSYRSTRSYYGNSYYNSCPNRGSRYRSHYDYNPSYYRRYQSGHWHR